MKVIATKIVAFTCACFIALSAFAATPVESCFNYKKAQDYSRAVQAGREAVRVTPKSGDGYLCLGQSYHQLGDLDLAFTNLQQAERRYSGKNDLAIVYSEMGQISSLKGDLQQSLNYYSRSLGLVREIGNKSSEAAMLGNIAGIFSDRGDMDKALDYYSQDLSTEPVESRKATTYNNIAMVYSQHYS